MVQQSVNAGIIGELNQAACRPGGLVQQQAGPQSSTQGGLFAIYRVPAPLWSDPMRLQQGASMSNEIRGRLFAWIVFARVKQ